MIFWITFGVFFGLIPVALNAFKIKMPDHVDWNFTDLLGKGDLFVIAAVISGGALGELIAAFLAKDYSGRGFLFKLFVGLATFGLTVAILANIIGYFVTKDPFIVRNSSEWVAGLSLIPSATVVALAAT